METSRAALGAYGLRLGGLDDATAHLHPVPAEWPEVALRFEDAPDPAVRRDPGTVEIGDGVAELWLAEAGRITVRRDPASVTFATRTRLSPDAVLHPFLGLPAAILGRWMGRMSFHGGAFIHGGRAWGLLGEREAGKSATLAQLLARGTPVLSDDILILEGSDLLAGPRTIDLRADAGRRAGGEPLGLIGNRERWRLRPDQGPAQMRLGGFVDLRWGDGTALTVLPARERLGRLIASTVFRPDATQAIALLELAALPALRLTRPQGLDGLPRLTERLIAALPSLEP